MKKAIGYRTRVHTIEEGWNLCCSIMRTGCEGVQNDSSRYNDIMLKRAYNKIGYCWVGIHAQENKWSHGCLRVVSVHDKWGRKNLQELGRDAFLRKLGVKYEKKELPKSLRRKQQ